MELYKTSRNYNHFFFIIALLGLLIISHFNFLLFHTLAELFSIVIGVSIFIIMWTGRRYLQNNYFMIIAIGFFFASLIDIVHTLSYKGMPFFGDLSPNLPTQLWIAARLLQALTFLIAPICINRKTKFALAVMVFTTVSTGLLFLIFSGLFPDCFIEGTGLTDFKKNTEYIISAILIFSAFWLFRSRQAFDQRIYRLVMSALILTIGSELAFTFYINVNDLPNLIGHIFKILAFYLMGIALITVSLEEPQAIMFKELKEKENQLEKRVEERSRELARAQEQLLQQEKLAILGKMASSVGHELRNPLAVINNALYVLNNIKDDSSKTKEYMRMIAQEIGRADKIISDLLTFSRVKPGEKTAIDIKQTFQNVLKRVLPSDTIQIENNLANNLQPVYADQNQIEQVLINLVSNACQAMPEGGCLTLNASQEDDMTCLKMQDTGVGIAPENLERIFEPLFTTKAKGIGLGLTVTKMLVEANEGYIQVESVLGKGSTFTVCLPCNP